MCSVLPCTGPDESWHEIYRPQKQFLPLFPWCLICWSFTEADDLVLDVSEPIRTIFFRWSDHLSIQKIQIPLFFFLHQRDLKKTSSRYQSAVGDLQTTDRKVHERKKMISTMADELAALRRANDRKMKVSVNLQRGERRLSNQEDVKKGN